MRCRGRTKTNNSTSLHLCENSSDSFAAQLRHERQTTRAFPLSDVVSCDHEGVCSPPAQESKTQGVGRGSVGDVLNSLHFTLTAVEPSGSVHRFHSPSDIAGCPEFSISACAQEPGAPLWILPPSRLCFELSINSFMIRSNTNLSVLSNAGISHLTYAL